MMYKAIIFFSLAFPSLLEGQGQLNMSLLGRWDDPALPSAGSIRYNDIWGYADCEGNEYAIVGSAGYIHFFDITAPSNPVEVARFAGSVNSIWRDFKTYGDFAYAVADQGNDGLMVFDLSQLPDSVSLAFQDNSRFTRSHNVFIDEPTGRLYLAGSNAISGGVAAYSLAESPGEPEFLGAWPLPGGYFHDIYVRNHTAYCSHGGNGLWVYDFSVLDSIRALGSLTSYPQQGYNHSSWLDEEGARLVFADETHGTSLKLADVSDPADIRILSLFRSELLAPAATNSIPHNPFIRGQYAIVSYYHDGVQVFNLSNPEEVERVAYYDTYPENQGYPGYQGCWGVYPFLPSGNIIASDISHGLFILSADSIALGGATPLEAGIEVLAGNLSACEGDTTLLGASPAGLETYEWLLNGELVGSGLEFPATRPGIYQLVVSDGRCTKISEPAELLFSPAPEAILPESPYIYCGEAPPAISTSSQGDAYNWFLNGEQLVGEHQETLEITEGGVYQVEVIAGGCSSRSDELEVILGQMPAPLANIVFPDSYCLGADAVLLDGAGSGNQYFVITETSSGTTDTFANHYAITASGTYFLEAFTEYCSMAIEPPLEVFFHEPAVPALTADGNRLTSSPATAYQWYQDEDPIPGATGQQYTVEESGQYAVETIDANGCAARSETVLVEVSSSTGVLAGKGIRFYPNPVRDGLWLEATNPPQAYRITTPDGREAARWQQWRAGAQAIPMGSLPDGIYLIQLLFGDGIGSLRVVKKQ